MKDCIRYRMELDIFQNSVYYFTVNVQVYNIDVRCVYQVTESFGGHGEVSSYGQAVFVFLYSIQYTRNTIVLTQFVSCFLSYVCSDSTFNFN